MLRVGVVSLVMVSAPDPLLSLKLLMIGAAGEVASMVMLWAGEAALTLPAVSVAFAVKE